MTVLTGARLSSMSRCPRQCAYTALNTTGDPLPLDAQEYFARGQMFELYVGWQLDAKHGRENVQRQVPVPWGAGYEGHADFVIDGGTVVEVVSTVVPSPLVFTFKAGQAKRYMHFLGHERGVVHVVNPSRLTQADMLPLRLTDDDREQFTAEVAAVTEAVKSAGEVLPDRVCRKPGDARAHLCPYASECFKDWVAPAASEDDREQARRAALDLYQAKQHERNLEAQLTAIEDERKQAQAALSELLEPGETQVGPFLVKRIPVRGRVTVKNELLKSGLIPDELLAPYVNVSDGYDRFEIARVSDETALTGDDFGSEAPWTDDDLRGAA